jgi:hypothetical protein
MSHSRPFMFQPTAPPLISSSVAEFITSGLSITVASRDERFVPSIAKAVACRVSPDLRQICVLVFAEAAEAVCRDIAATGLLAVCFSRPSTTRTVQIKGADATIALATPADVAIARRSLDLLVDDLVPHGFKPDMLEAFFWGTPTDLMAVRFTPDAAFAQTPGPAAGTVLQA